MRSASSIIPPENKNSRKHIIDCTIEVVIEEGYANASLAKIAVQAGMTKGLVAYYFVNKAGLMREVVMDLYRRAGTSIVLSLSNQNTFTEKVAAYIATNLKFIADNRSHVAAMMNIVANFRSKNGEMMFNPMNPEHAVEHLAGLFAEGQKAGEWYHASPTMAAISLRASIDVAAARLVADSTFDIDTYCTELILLFSGKNAAVSHEQDH